jgi:type II secretory pathway component PulF
MEITLPLFLRIRKKELIAFSRELAIMVSATVPIVEALRVLERQATNRYFKKVIQEIKDDVEGGTRLSTAFLRFPYLFSSFFANMIKSGETTGRLDEVLNYLADQQEKDYNLMSRIRGALIYPAFIFSGMVIVGFLMLVFVLPQLITVLEESGASLPLSTRILIATSNFFSHHWLFALLGFLIALITLTYGKRTPRGKYWWDTLKVYFPLLGNIFRHIYLLRFTRSLHTLLAGGVPLTNALSATSDVISNALYKDLIVRTVKEVRDGRPLTSVFETSKLFPKTVNQILNVGEQTGKLDEVLLKLTNFYTLELETSVQTLVSLIEPMIIVILGIGVGIVVSAVILPMYQMVSQY